MLQLSGTIVRSNYLGHEISFFVRNNIDEIQRKNLAGQFYEIEELNIISKWFKSGDVFLDVGTNIGNHTIFVCKILNAKQSIVIEPTPQAIDILKVNIDINGLRDAVDTSLLGLGLSDAEKKATAIIAPNNLGGTLMDVNSNGTIQLVPGDSIVRGRKIDFIKMDVEGHELTALRGLRGTIDDNRPKMFIEVNIGNIANFKKFVESINYVITDTYSRYDSNENFLVVPEECV